MVPTIIYFTLPSQYLCGTEKIYWISKRYGTGPFEKKVSWVPAAFVWLTALAGVEENSLGMEEMEG